MPTAGLLAVLHVLTLNIWGLPDAGFRILSPFRTARVSAICEELRRQSQDANLNLELVILQEVWVKEDRETLQHCGFPYAADRDDPSRILDSGLLILSKYPVDRVERYVYSQSGDVSKLLSDGEALARKSALIARVQHPVAGPVWIADTHLVSIYDPRHDTYQETRRAQFHDYVTWAKSLAGNEPLILGGDFNFGPTSPIWADVPQTLQGFAQSPGAERTCTICPPNIMHSHDEGKIDHLFGSSRALPVTGGIAMETPITLNGITLNYSDHFGWRTAFQLVR